MATKAKQPEDFIRPLNLGGMRGRMLYMPAPAKYKNQKIIFLYGQHASLERMWGLLEVMNRYGEVTMPDLPGFGGMESFYKVHQKPSLDNLADYLETFIRWRFKKQKVVIVGLSFGFLVATRMLQRYPQMQKQVKLLVSIVGFSHRDDFTFSRTRFLSYKYACALFTLRTPAWVFQHVFLQPAWIRRVYSHSYNAKDKFTGKAGDEFKRTMDFEVNLWQINDIRTQMFCNGEMFRLDHCKQRIDVPFYHVSVDMDRYFDHDAVEQRLRVIFENYRSGRSKMKGHSMSYIADKKTADPLVPSELKRVLRELGR